MREPATLSRRSAAALPFAALIGPVAATVPAIATAGANDAALLDLGRRWEAAWDAQVAHDRAWSSALSDTAALAHEAEGDRLFAAENALFDAIMATPARSIAGLAVKAQVLARAHDVEDRGVEAVEAAAASAWELTTRAALSLTLDALKLAGAAS